MYRAALTLTLCLATGGIAAGAGDPVPVPSAMPGSGQATAVPLLLPLMNEPEPTGSRAGSAARETGPGRAEEGTSPVQEIVAGILTGSLAAVLMLKLVYRRRRKEDPR